jgi:putative hydrolase of the HAD superfamily
MIKATSITCLFLDIGGVLLTNGWDHHQRQRAAMHFKLDWAEMDNRHNLTFDTYEEGKITLTEYLERVVFYKKRAFTFAQFRSFMFAQSQPCAPMLELIPRLKAKHGLKVIVVSNESRELNTHRIRTYKLSAFVDSFISSCFVHLRKPDADLYRLALDMAQAPVGQVLYIENTPMFVQVAESLGIRSILHTDYHSTKMKLASFGLPDDPDADETGRSWTPHGTSNAKVPVGKGVIA